MFCFIRKIFNHNKVQALLLMILGCSLGLVLVSYNSGDSSWNVISNQESKNIFGIFGAYCADILYQSLGLSALLLPTYCINKSLKIWKSQSRYFSFSIIILLCTMFTFSISLARVKIDYLPAGGGGMIGLLFLSFFLKNFLYIDYISGIISIILVIFLLEINFFTLLYYIKIIFKFLSVSCNNFYLIFLKKLLYFMRNVLHTTKLIGKTSILNSDNGVVIKKDKITTNQDFENNSYLKKNIKKCPTTQLPSIFLLKDTGIKTFESESSIELQKRASILLNVLNDFGIRGKIINISQGPVVTLYEFEPAAGIKSSRVIGLSDDIARSLSALSTRIALIPGKNVLGIELPNKNRSFFRIKELIEAIEYKNNDIILPLVLGKDLSGAPVVTDLAKMPHLLVAGTTGSGKSVAINSMIISLLFRYSPLECKFIMIDPKMLELSSYDGIPHLLTPVVTEPSKAVIALKWAVKEMENRYRMMSNIGVRNIIGYNNKILDAMNSGKKLEREVQTGFDPETGNPIYNTISIAIAKLPFIVIIVDEMADLMLVAGKDIEISVQRLAQMARAAGIHIIMATQRPSVDVITGVIKANFPSRISFKVTSKIDSRTILGEQGAEQLLGMGDMLYIGSASKITRIHGPFIDDIEVENITNYLKSIGRPEYIASVIESLDQEETNLNPSYEGTNSDTLYQKALNIVETERKVSISYIQRCLRIGYNKAANIVEQMEKQGIISAPNHVGKREILLQKKEF